jgi:transcriptional regulator with XRE-family HTH domain
LTVDRATRRLFDVSDDASSVQNGARSATVVSTVGDNIRRLRARAGMSLRELAANAGVSTSTLSGIEAGSGNPGVETLVNIGGALGVPFSDLVMPHEPDVQVQRAGEGPVVEAAGADFTSRLLLAERSRSVTEVYDVTMEPGDVYRAEPHLPGVTESVIVVAGHMRLGPLDATVELGPGDRATFAADQVHTYEALAEGTRMVMVLSYR